MDSQEKTWFVYQNQQQSGPFHSSTIIEKIQSGEFTSFVYLYKAGWKDWQPLNECLVELGIQPTTPPPPPSAGVAASNPVGIEEVSTNTNERSPRATVAGQVIVHNNNELMIGSGVNISASGLFVETTKLLFEVGDKLKVTCKVAGGQIRPFQAEAEVMRYNNSEPMGYGLRFIHLDEEICHQIQNLIDQANAILSNSNS
ncbi:MAG: PilZ domain-containing protein [Zetaproteobacteria bacterium]|nr:PilZ domain-containing protein [Zetaproteobacteria bacterium]